MRTPARLIVALRYLIVPAWIAAAVWISISLPSIFGSEASELGSLLPRFIGRVDDVPAQEAQLRAVPLLDAPGLLGPVLAQPPGPGNGRSRSTPSASSPSRCPPGS